MRRRHRVALATLAGVSAVALVLGLTFAGSQSEGPLSAALSEIGRVIGRLETATAQRLRGPGRRAELDWLAPFRAEPSLLAHSPVPLLGAFHHDTPASLAGVLELERALGVTFPLIHGYFAWGDKPHQRFPVDFVEAVAALGSLPVMTWEPWLTDFESRLHPHLPLRAERDRGGLAAIARGDYDFYVDAWARQAAAFGQPLLLRFAHEMNDPYRYPWGPHHNHPFDFIAAWEHVVARFAAAGASNVLWVWSPHVAYEGYEWFYPGDSVDWVATGALNYGPVARWSEWWSFSEIFGDRYEPLASYGKPILIAELGSLEVGGDRERWYREALRDLPERYPAVRALLFFAVASDATVTYQPLDWTFLDNPAVTRAVAEEIARWGEPPSRATPGELPSGPGAPLIRAPTAPEARPPAG